MRNPNRIPPFLQAFEALWREYPDLRFGQLCFAIAGTEDTFYWEEEKWLTKIAEARESLANATRT